jgi:hypothetical protein
MIDQRSPEWYAERAGHVTASRIDDVLSEGKGGKESAGRRNYRAQLAVERLLKRSLDDEGFVSKPMQWGVDTEPLARSWYMGQRDCLVAQLGFTKHPSVTWVGCSPDSEVSDEGGLEIKCPNTATHIDTLLNGAMTYNRQVQCQMWVMGWKWVDFVSFDPRMPVELMGVIIRVPRDQKFIDDMAHKVDVFLAEVDKMHKSLEVKCSRH